MILKTLITVLQIWAISGIYDFSIPAADGTTIHLKDYAGKKILIVSTASGSRFAPQYAKLEQLYQQYKNSLVIIVVPSNSFNNETDDNAALLNKLKTTYNIHYLIAAKAEVSGDNQSALFHWLHTGSENGTIKNTPKDDFQKYLIDKDGTLIGVYAAVVDPLSPDLINDIKQ